MGFLELVVTLYLYLSKFVGFSELSMAVYLYDYIYLICGVFRTFNGCSGVFRTFNGSSFLGLYFSFCCGTQNRIQSIWRPVLRLLSPQSNLTEGYGVYFNSFTGQSMREDGAPVFAYYKEGSTNPTFVYFRDGLKKVKS